MLAMREHSRLELRRKLRQRGYEADVVDAVMSRLIAAGLQSDECFAESYVSSRAGKGYGPQRVRMELRERGVADYLIETAIEASAVEWFDLLRQAHDKKFGPRRPKDVKEKAARVRFLQYRGFEGEQIRRLLDAND